MSLNGRITVLERERPPGECACGTVHIVVVGHEDEPSGPVPPCPTCGNEPLVIRIIRGDGGEPYDRKG